MHRETGGRGTILNLSRKTIDFYNKRLSDRKGHSWVEIFARSPGGELEEKLTGKTGVDCLGNEENAIQLGAHSFSAGGFILAREGNRRPSIGSQLMYQLVYRQGFNFCFLVLYQTSSYQKKKSSFSVLNSPFPKLQKIWSPHCSSSSRPPATSPLEEPSCWTRTALLLWVWFQPFSCLCLWYLQSISYLDVYVEQFLNWGVPRFPSKIVFLPHSTFIWTLLKHQSAISKLTVPASISGLGFSLEFQNHLPDWFPGISTCTS